MTVNERFKILLENVEKGNQSRFSKKTGIPNTTLSSYLPNGSRVSSPNAENLGKIIKAYPQVRIEWLLTGEGEWQKVDTNTQLQKIKEPRNNGGVVVATQTLDRVVTVPMVNVRAAANYVSGYQTQEYYEKLDAAVLPLDFTRGKHSLLLQIDGDSMQPTYFDKQWVLGTYVEKSDWMDIPDLEAFIIVSNKGIQVKRVKNRFPEGFIRCRSDNRKLHKPFSLDYPEILEIWRVTAYFTNYMPNLADDMFWKVDHIDEKQQDLLLLYEQMKEEIEVIKKGLNK